MSNVSRLDYFRGLFVWRVVLVVYAVAGLYDLFVGQFASDWPRIADGAGLLGNAIPIYWWVISGLALLVAATFEGGYRQISALAPMARETHANLVLVHEPGRHPYWYEEAGYHRVGVMNSGPSSAEGVAVTLISIMPPPPYKEMNPLPSRLGEKGGYCRGNNCEINKGDEHLYDVLRDLTPQGMPEGSVWGLLTIENTDWQIGFKEDADYFFEVRITAKNQAGDARYGYLRVRQKPGGGLDINVVDSLPSGLAPETQPDAGAEGAQQLKPEQDDLARLLSYKDEAEEYESD